MIVVEAENPLAAAQTRFGALHDDENLGHFEWIRVVTSWHDNGAVCSMLCVPVRLTPMARGNG